MKKMEEEIEIPIFPLNLVVFPGSKINLHIFEPRYRQMMKYCVQKAKVLKGDPKAKAHLVRVGKSIDNLKISSSLSMGNLEDLYKMRKPKDQPK